MDTSIGCDRINVSIRDASLGAGITPKTARASLKRLCDAGWLERTASNRRYTGNADEFKVRHNAPYNSLRYLEIHMGSNGAVVDSSHECWLRLGKAAATIYSCLSTEPLSARRIAAKAGVGNRTADRQLPRLAEHELARQVYDGWVIGRLSPDEVVYAFGWIEEHSIKAMREYQVEVDREYWRRNCAA